MLPPASVKDCLALLRFHLEQPDVPLLVKPGTLTQGLVEAGVLTMQGFFNPDLDKLTPLLDSPHLAAFIPAEAGGHLLALLAQWDPGDAEALKSILREAVARKKSQEPEITRQALSVEPQRQPDDQKAQPKRRGQERPAKASDQQHVPIKKTASECKVCAALQTTPGEETPYAVKLHQLLAKHPLDEALFGKSIHHADKPERLIIKIRVDLATRSIVEQANPKEPAVARWHLYQALTQNEEYVPTWGELESAGIDMQKDSLPALRAHRKRGGLYVIPCQLVLHLGESKLRVAVFSGSTPQNQSLYDLMRQVAGKLPLPEGLRLSDIRSKTFQLDATINDPGLLSIEELYGKIQCIWEKLFLFLGRLNKIITADIARALMKEHAGRPLLADDYVLITDEGAAALKRHDDELHLNGLTSLSEREANELSQNNETIHLDGLKELSDEAAEALTTHQGDLSLRGLIRLSDAAARALARHRGRLFLDGLTHLADYTAQALSEQPGDDLDLLSLNGLTHLSDPAARWLAKRRGGLCLQGLTSLSDAAAEALSKQPANQVDPLRLDGLTRLSEAAARALAEYPGEVQFEALPAEDRKLFEYYRQKQRMASP